MSFDSNAELDAAVLADIQAASSEATPEIPSHEVEAPKVAAASPEVPNPAAVPATPEKETEEEKVERVARVIKWKGQEVKVDPTAEDELIQKGFDYTQKTMELAAYRRQMDAKIAEIQSQADEQSRAVQNLFNDPDKLEAVVNAARQRLGLAPVDPTYAPNDPNDPDQFVSKAELQRQLTAIREMAASESQKAKAEAKSEIELSTMQGAFKSDFDRTLDTLVRDKYPLLAEFGDEDVADKIRRDAYQFTQNFMTLNPGVPLDPNQVKSVMAESAKRRADKLEGKLRERDKRSAVSQSKLTSRGVEPRGGTPPPAPLAGKPMKLNDPSLEAQVLQEIQALMK